MFKKLSLALVTAIGFSVMASSAFAATVNTYKWYDTKACYFCPTIPGTPGNGGGQNVGTSEIFTADNGLQVTASFLSGVNTNNGTGGIAANGYWGHGLGVIGFESNSMDAARGEAILFDFGVSVVALSTLVWETPNSTGYADVSIWVDGVKVANSVDISGSPDTVNLGSVVGSKILIMNVDGYPVNNRLRVKALSVQTIDREEVPEPAAIALIGLGLMGMGAVTRRRKFA